ncbi:uncharacterized protein [Miscanthus floridulus]|uniref:uncharacterized protein n=1 Tax=Miscanthus floridulus TaxID=154761 RepID=UPI003459972C
MNTSDCRACLDGSTQDMATYADGSLTGGDLARDTLTLPTAPSESDAIPGFVFGCGHDNTGFFGTEDGLIGLGRRSVSLSSQAAGRYGGPVFSYCLPSLSSGAGYLALGVCGAAGERVVHGDGAQPRPAVAVLRPARRRHGRRAGGEGPSGENARQLGHPAHQPPRQHVRRGLVGVRVPDGEVQVQEGARAAIPLQLHRPRRSAGAGGGPRVIQISDSANRAPCVKRFTWIFSFAAITMQRGLDGHNCCVTGCKAKNPLYAFVRKELKRRTCT